MSMIFILMIDLPYILIVSKNVDLITKKGGKIINTIARNSIQKWFFYVYQKNLTQKSNKLHRNSSSK